MKVIVIGAGYFGINYVRELVGNLVAVIEPDEERAKFVAQSYNVAVHPAIPADLQYDGVIIATPPEDHIKIALEEVKKGKYALIEKPMATSVQEMLLLRNYRHLMMSGLIYLYNPSFLNFCAQVEQLPEINHIFARRTNNGPVRSWQDATWDLAAHDISMLNYLFGSPDRISGFVNRDYAVLDIGYYHIQAFVYVSWRGGPKTRRFEVVPFDGDRLIFDDMAVTHNISPLRLMLDDFLSGSWNEKASWEAGLEVISILEAVSRN